MDLTPLRRHRDFRWLYLAQSVSFLGTMVTSVALPYQMFQRTHSSLAVGLLGVAELVPLLTTAFVGGALADAWDRKRIVMMCHLGLGAGTALMALNALRQPPVWTLYVAAAWLSGLSGLQRPSLESMGQRLVDRDEMAAMAALGFVRGSIGMIAGPAIGGMLIASGGIAITYLFDVATYVFSLAAIVRLRIPAADPAAARPSLGGILEGLRYARSRQELIGTYVVDFVAMIFGLPIALFPALSERLGGAVALGPLYAAPAVGALVAAVTSGWTGRVHRHGYAVLWAAAAWGLAIVAFGFTDHLLPALFFLALAGGADAVSGIFRGTIWNQTIPQTLRGRLVAIEMVSYMSGPLLGHVEAGMVAAVWGLRASIVSGGVLCVVGVFVCGALLPQFVHYDARQRPAV